MFTFEYIFIENQFIYFSSTSVRKWLKRKLEYKRNPRFLQCPLLPNTQCQDLQSRLWVSISLTLTYLFKLTYLHTSTHTYSLTDSLTYSLTDSLTYYHQLSHFISLLLTTQYNTTLFTLPFNCTVHSLSTRNLYSF